MNDLCFAKACLPHVCVGSPSHCCTSPPPPESKPCPDKSLLALSGNLHTGAADCRGGQREQAGTRQKAHSLIGAEFSGCIWNNTFIYAYNYSGTPAASFCFHWVTLRQYDWQHHRQGAGCPVYRERSELYAQRDAQGSASGASAPRPLSLSR